MSTALTCAPVVADAQRNCTQGFVTRAPIACTPSALISVIVSVSTAVNAPALALASHSVIVPIAPLPLDAELESKSIDSRLAMPAELVSCVAVPEPEVVGMPP